MMQAGHLRPAIRDCHVRKVIVPFEQSLRTASGVMQAAPLVLMDIHTDAGVVGHAYLFCYTPTVLNAVAQLTRDVSATLAGQPLAPYSALQTLRAKFKLLGTSGLLDMVLSAIDMALWDAWAKFLGQPLSVLLGADLSEPRTVPVYASYGMESAEQTASNVERALQEGHRFVKIKIGHPTLQADLQVVESALRVMNSAACLLVDYNQSLSVAEAIVRCKALDDYGLTWIEEPTHFDDLNGHAQIARSATTPIQLGENLWGPSQVAAALAVGASDLMMPDLAKIGGVTGWMQTSAICGAQHVPISNHFYQEISVHLMLVTPSAHMLEFFRMADPILEHGLELCDGRALVSDRPGNGMSWREDRIANYQA